MRALDPYIVQRGGGGGVSKNLMLKGGARQKLNAEGGREGKKV